MMYSSRTQDPEEDEYNVRAMCPIITTLHHEMSRHDATGIDTTSNPSADPSHH
jgi:hypothetical protein